MIFSLRKMFSNSVVHRQNRNNHLATSTTSAISHLVMPLFKINGIDIYGSKIWYVIHLCALGYKEHHKLLYHPYQAFILAISELLPCKVCQSHFKENLNKYKLEHYLYDFTGLFLWSYLIHNEVNISKDKTSPSYSACLRFTSEELTTLNILPNLFYMLFTLASSTQNKKKFSHFIVLLSSLKFLIPQDLVRNLYKEALLKYESVFFDVSPLYCVYLLYQHVHERLNLYFYAYNIILKHFQIP